jgi:hypothetical protein
MFRRLQRAAFFPFCAVLVLSGSVSLSIVSQFHDLSDDEVGGPALVLHDESAHRIVAAKSAYPADQHCLLCHWFQSHRTLETVVVLSVPTARSRWCDVQLASFVSIAPLELLAARAPPLV